jgi:hypothetical protein
MRLSSEGAARSLANTALLPKLPPLLQSEIGSIAHTWGLRPAVAGLQPRLLFSRAFGA